VTNDNNVKTQKKGIIQGFMNLRPNPDLLLEEIQQVEAQEKRGRLTIFFGSSPGVGKTYAMLADAKLEKARGVDVVIGIVETHKRQETEQLAEGLPTLPLKQVSYKGKMLTEFDLEAALKRRPKLILVDELAHTNLGDNRHAKRWQDIEELLASGIDVYTTLNVQHLQSLNDIVSQITGIRVWETIPDHVFQKADEVRIIDLPPDDLLERLQEGKIYMPQQVEMAKDHFFKKGNLLALRELALRTIADRVDDQVCRYQTKAAADAVWVTKDRLLVYLDPSLDPEGLVRAASRMANGLRAEWVVVVFKNCQGLKGHQNGIYKALQLAEELGAETQQLLDGDRIELLKEYAHAYHATKILVQVKPPSFWDYGSFRRNFAVRLLRALDHLEVCFIQSKSMDGVLLSQKFGSWLDRWTFHRGHLMAIALPILLSQLALWAPFEWNAFYALFAYGSLSMALAFFFGSTVGSLSFGMSGLLELALGNDLESWMVRYPMAGWLVVVFVLGIVIVIGRLSLGLKLQSKAALQQTFGVKTVYKMSQELSAALTLETIVEIGVRYLRQIFPGEVFVFVPDATDALVAKGQAIEGSQVKIGIAQWVYTHNQPAGFGSETLPASPFVYAPLSAPMKVRGVVVLKPEDLGQWESAETFERLKTCLAPLALALERVYYLDMAQNALISAESERFQGAILTTISKSFKKPLQRILEVVAGIQANGTAPSQGPVEEIQKYTTDLQLLVKNLEDMTRLQLGQVALEFAFEKMSDVIHHALATSSASLAGYAVELQLSSQLPLIRLDRKLIERVFWHLFENITRYTPLKTVIQIEAHTEASFLMVSIEDNGPGLPEGMEEKVFEKFTRGAPIGYTNTGLGLGLSICRAIIECHSGKIWAESLPGKGTRFTFRIPFDK
jgi:two-component system sensor histidine kinase KdpD